jgi:hypothetical protein
VSDMAMSIGIAGAVTLTTVALLFLADYPQRQRFTKGVSSIRP